jgi:hypothetical protein
LISIYKPSIMSMPPEIYNMVLNDYLTIYDNKNINKHIESIRQKKIKSSIYKINKLLYKYIINQRHDMDIEEYYIPKLLYKKYYPLSLRKSFILLVIKKNNLIRYNEIINVFNIYNNNPKNKLVITFNKIIDLLSNNELFDIGW